MIGWLPWVQLFVVKEKPGWRRCGLARFLRVETREEAAATAAVAAVTANKLIGDYVLACRL